jgi:hypothetical protein
LGTLATAGLIAPVVGFIWTAILLAALNLLSGWLAWHAPMKRAPQMASPPPNLNLNLNLNPLASQRKLAGMLIGPCHKTGE